MTRIHAADLIRWINESRMPAMGNDRSEVRALSFMLMVVFFALVAEPGYFISFVDESLQWRVASLCHYGRVPVGAAFLLSAAMLLPHLFALAFLPGKLGCRWPRKMAAGSCIVAACAWGMLSYLSEPIDYDWLTTLFVVKCFIALWLGIIVGLSLNAQQAREKASSLMRWQRIKDALTASQRNFNEV